MPPRHINHVQRSLLTASALLLLGCASDPGADPTTSGRPPDDPGVGHVHDLGVDPLDDTLFVASHHGVFRVDGGKATRVADRWQDTMAFTVVGPGHFLASGHPDMREDLPTHLGLIESTDSAKTWQPVSMQGEADLHAIEVGAGRVYAYDAISERLLTSTDRRTWSTLARIQVADLAADPSDGEHLLVATPNGTTLRARGGATMQPLRSAPDLRLVDWPTARQVVGLTADGDVVVSPDEGVTWQKVGSLDGPVHALAAAPDRWHVATDQGVLVSTDEGRTWELVLDTAP